MDDKGFSYQTFASKEDAKGVYYCRAVNGVLEIDGTGNRLCGNGCPCLIGEMPDMCGYYDKPLHEPCSPYEMKIRNDKRISDGTIPLFPQVKGISERMQRAYEFAANAHRTQCRKGGDIPYMTHLIMVANNVVEITDDEDVIIAALLHDTLEDTDTGREDIEAHFGAKVAELVAFDSEDKLSGMSAEESWKLRKTENIHRISMAPVEVKMIAISDKVANLSSIESDYILMGDRVFERFHQRDKKEHEWYYRSFRDILHEFDKSSLMKEYDRILAAVF